MGIQKNAEEKNGVELNVAEEGVETWNSVAQVRIKWSSLLLRIALRP